MALGEPTTHPLFRGETPDGFAACLAPPNPARSELTPPASLRSGPRKFLRALLKLVCGLGVIMEPRGGPGKPMAFPDLWTHYPLSITQRELLLRTTQDEVLSRYIRKFRKSLPLRTLFNVRVVP